MVGAMAEKKARFKTFNPINNDGAVCRHLLHIRRKQISACQIHTIQYDLSINMNTKSLPGQYVSIRIHLSNFISCHAALQRATTRKTKKKMGKSENAMESTAKAIEDTMYWLDIKLNVSTMQTRRKL